MENSPLPTIFSVDSNSFFRIEKNKISELASENSNDDMLQWHMRDFRFLSQKKL